MAIKNIKIEGESKESAKKQNIALLKLRQEIS